jgi:hypothetical protein
MRDCEYPAKERRQAAPPFHEVHVERNWVGREHGSLSSAMVLGMGRIDS